MILRYYETDWSIPCIENEFLFAGTKQECIKYLLEHWSVDCKELENNIELQATFCDYLRHIEIGTILCPAIYDDKTIKRLWNEGKDWDSHCEWKHIDSTKFIFNRELIEIVDSMPIDSDADTSITGIFEYPMWEQVFEEELYNEY